MKSRFITIVAASLLAAVPFLTSCGKSNKTVVGFAQTGSESGWRNANTVSVKSEAEKQGIDLKFVDAQSKVENQHKAIGDFIAQRVNLIVLEPIAVDGWDSDLKAAKDAKIPVIIADRNVSAPSDLYATFIGSDFLDEGRKAGEWLAKKTGGKAVILEMEGEVGSAPARDRKAGFDEVIAKNPGMKIIKSQTAAFRRKEGTDLMNTWIQDPDFKDVTVLYAHNDDMALGAITALEKAGKTPGKDIMIVSVDGTKDGIQALRDGKIACIVECNPLLGPQIFDNAQKILKGENVEKVQKSIEAVYDQEGLDFGRPEKAININKSEVKGF